MIVVAGPPGSGKSTAFPLQRFGVDYFNADDVAAKMNAGRYVNISQKIRRAVNRKLEQFVNQHIGNQHSFAIETTLRTSITFEQANRARLKGFRLIMYYLAVDGAELAIERVAIRADSGGHSAPTDFVYRTYYKSLKNCVTALREFDRVFVFDNSLVNHKPRPVLEAAYGVLKPATSDIPNWTRVVLTEFQTDG